MNLLATTSIFKVDKIKQPENCNFSRPNFKVSESEFYLNVKNVAHYLVQNGEKILISPYENTDEESINLYLEGSALGALLHQQGNLPFHGSSFLYKNKGIMICGNSGAGKSSVTAAFCQNNAIYINDDISPVSVSDSQVSILPVKTRIKLWDDTLNKLNISFDNLNRIRPEMEKFYLSFEEKAPTPQTLNYIFILSTHNKNEYRATELEGMEKYNALRKQIYRRIYLKGMPETEKKYFVQLFSLANKVRLTRILRPQICDIQETMRFIGNEIES
nr:hypothetical protein [uncultured Draconibacterium sp.]